MRDGIKYLVVQTIEHPFSKPYEIDDSIGYGQILPNLSVDTLGKCIRLLTVLERLCKGVENLGTMSRKWTS